MKRFVTVLFAVLLVGAMIGLATGNAIALVAPNEPFQRALDAPRMYVTQIYVPAYTPTELRTLDSAPGVDPMLFVTANGAPVAASDDAVGYDPRTVLYFHTGRWVRVFVASFDAAYAGWTTFRYRKGSDPAVDISVWAGGAAVQTRWREGDIVSSASSYWGRPVREVCESLDDWPVTPWDSAVWNEATGECDLLQGNATEHKTADEVCQVLNMGYRSVNQRSDRCEHASDAKDTIVLAMDFWDKMDTVCFEIPAPDINTSGFLFCFEAAVPPALQGVDDDSGAGRNFRMTMQDDSLGVDDSSALLVGLYPYITDFSSDHDGGYIDDTENGPCHEIRKLIAERGWSNDFPWWFHLEGDWRLCPASSTSEQGITSDWIRLYRDNYLDRQTGEWADPDYDGLSSALEEKLGTNEHLSDSNYDGIMDGLEVYGPIWDVRDWTESPTSHRYTLRSYLPLPYFGADPLQKNIVVEVDRQQTTAASFANRALAAETTYNAFAEAGIHTLLLEDGPNARAIIPDDTPIGDGYTFDDSGLSKDLRDHCGEYFDLIDYSFARHFSWTGKCGPPDDPSKNYCGISSTIVDSYVGTERLLAPTGRFITAVCPRSMVHELGHLMGFSHSGAGWHYRNPDMIEDPTNPGTYLKREYTNQPNYWSVMSYGVTVPLHQSADGVPYDSDLNLNRPANHFSREWMIDLDETQLFEWNGLMGHTPLGNLPLIYQFDGGWHHGLRVDWMDWDKDQENDLSTVDAVENLTLDGDDCFEDTSTVPHVFTNPVTGQSSADPNDVCPDYLEGNNDIEYLEAVDMSWFTKTLARGLPLGGGSSSR